MDLAKEFTREQLEFIEKVCGVGEDKFRHMKLKEVFDEVVEKLVMVEGELEFGENDEEYESDRVKMATGILNIVSKNWRKWEAVEQEKQQ